MLTLAGSILTPALVASLFSLLFNARAEKRREIRKALGDTFDEARQVVSDAVVAAGDYFSVSAKDRTGTLEAKLWLAERELRLSLSALTERSEPAMEAELQKLQNDFDLLVGYLTGGNFQEKNAKPDLAHVRKIAGVGADLRKSLGNLYFVELQASLSKDALDKVMRFFEFGDHYTPLHRLTASATTDKGKATPDP